MKNTEIDERLGKVQSSIDAITDIAIVIDSDFRIVLVNNTYKTSVNSEQYSEFFGKRPGELFHCVFSSLNELGCGHSDYCKYCLVSLKSAQINHSLIRTKTTIYSHENINDLNVEYDITVFNADDYDEYLIVVLKDISNETFMKVFFDLIGFDLANDISLIKNVFDILSQNDSTMPQDEFNELMSLTDISLENIKDLTAFQNQLCLEKNHAEINYQIINSLELMDDIKNQIQNLYKKKVVKISVSENSANQNFEAPYQLIRRLIKYLCINLIRMDDEDSDLRIDIQKEQVYLVIKISRNIAISDNYGLDTIIKKVTNNAQTEDLMFQGAKYLAEAMLKGKLEFGTVKNQGTYYRFIYPINEL
jgi:copper chaperone CopZ